MGKRRWRDLTERGKGTAKQREEKTFSSLIRYWE